MLLGVVALAMLSVVVVPVVHASNPVVSAIGYGVESAPGGSAFGPSSNTFNLATHPGSTILVWISCTGASVAVTSVTDSAGLTYGQAGAEYTAAYGTPGIGIDDELWYASYSTNSNTADSWTVNTSPNWYSCTSSVSYINSVMGVLFATVSSGHSQLNAQGDYESAYGVNPPADSWTVAQIPAGSVLVSGGSGTDVATGTYGSCVTSGYDSGSFSPSMTLDYGCNSANGGYTYVSNIAWNYYASSISSFSESYQSTLSVAGGYAESAAFSVVFTSNGGSSPPNCTALACYVGLGSGGITSSTQALTGNSTYLYVAETPALVGGIVTNVTVKISSTSLHVSSTAYTVGVYQVEHSCPAQHTCGGQPYQGDYNTISSSNPLAMVASCQGSLANGFSGYIHCPLSVAVLNGTVFAVTFSVVHTGVTAFQAGSGTLYQDSGDGYAPYYLNGITTSTPAVWFVGTMLLESLVSGGGTQTVTTTVTVNSGTAYTVTVTQGPCGTDPTCINGGGTSSTGFVVAVMLPLVMIMLPPLALGFALKGSGAPVGPGVAFGFVIGVALAAASGYLPWWSPGLMGVFGIPFFVRVFR